MQGWAREVIDSNFGRLRMFSNFFVIDSVSVILLQIEIFTL